MNSLIVADGTAVEVYSPAFASAILWHRRAVVVLQEAPTAEGEFNPNAGRKWGLTQLHVVLDTVPVGIPLECLPADEQTRLRTHKLTYQSIHSVLHYVEYAMNPVFALKILQELYNHNQLGGEIT